MVYVTVSARSCVVRRYDICYLVTYHIDRRNLTVVPCDQIDTEEGEDEVMICDQCGYSANVEVHPERYRVNCPEKGCPNVGVKIVKVSGKLRTRFLGFILIAILSCCVRNAANSAMQLFRASLEWLLN